MTINKGKFYTEPTVKTVFCANTIFVTKNKKNVSGVSTDRKALFSFSELHECHDL
jgi:hypothetical protein